MWSVTSAGVFALYCSVFCVVKFEQICQMFHIRLMIPEHEDVFLPIDVDLPLYITAVDQCVLLADVLRVRVEQISSTLSFYAKFSHQLLFSSATVIMVTLFLIFSKIIFRSKIYSQ